VVYATLQTPFNRIGSIIHLPPILFLLTIILLYITIIIVKGRYTMNEFLNLIITLIIVGISGFLCSFLCYLSYLKNKEEDDK